MELKIIDAYGQLPEDFAYLNIEEYIYSAGAQIVVRQLSTNQEIKNVYLR